MKIFLLEQSEVGGWDTYDSLVVIAENEESAKLISPYGREIDYETCRYADWVGLDNIDKIKVTYLGEAKEGSKQGVILASFNAG